jgi:DivIVA domain-containing protein
MEGTSGTPHLLTDVRFSVSRKGYDPDEVDNFLERVSAAVAQLQDKLRQAAGQAEAAEARAAEATKAQAVLQARIDALEGELAAAREGAVAAAPPAPVRDTQEDAEQASRVLVMAQRTADAAIEDAQNAARATLDEARTQAGTVVSEAEQEASRILAKARTDADDLVTHRRQALAEEVRHLETVRDAITGDVATLERHVAEQRGVLQASLARVQSVLDDPSAFRLEPTPSVSGAALADVTPAEVAVPGPPIDDAQPAEAASAPGRGEPDAGGEAGGPEGAEVVPTNGAAPAAQEHPDSGSVPSVAAVFEQPSPSPAGAASAGSGGSLFGSQDDQPTAAHATLSTDDESPLGPPDEKADAAMRAFFEAEFDDDPGRSAH